MVKGVEAGPAEFDSSLFVVILLDEAFIVADSIPGQSVDVPFPEINDPTFKVVTSGLAVGVKVGNGKVPVYVSVKNGIFDEIEVEAVCDEVVGRWCVLVQFLYFG